MIHEYNENLKMGMQKKGILKTLQEKKKDTIDYYKGRDSLAVG